MFKRYNRVDHHTHATIYLLNPFVGALSYYGITRTIQGFLDEGIARAIEATQQPEEVKHPDTLAFALMQLCYVLFLRGEPQEAGPFVARLAQVARQHGLFHTTVVADMFGGWVATEAGRLEEGLHTAQRAFKILWDAELYKRQGRQNARRVLQPVPQRPPQSGHMWPPKIRPYRGAFFVSLWIPEERDAQIESAAANAIAVERHRKPYVIEADDK